MGNFTTSNSPSDNDVLSFLNKTVTGTSNWDVINDITVGTPSATTGSITRQISVNPKSRKYEGSFNLTYTVTNATTTDISTILTNNILYDTNANSQFISTPSNAKLMARIKVLNSSININQLDVKTSTFGYDTTGSHANCFKVEIVPQSWSNMYTGSQWVYWKSALVVQFGTWPNPVTTGYSTTSIDLSLSRAVSGGTITYKFNDDSTENTSFKITNGASPKLELKTGQNAALYSCSVKATISGDLTYTGETPSYATSIAVSSQLVDPKMTSNNSNGFVASASTEQGGDTGRAAYTAFDGIKSGAPSNYWCGTNYGQDWIQIQLPSAKVLTFYSLTSMYLNSTWTDTNFKTWQVWGSNDPSFASYTTLDTENNIVWVAYPETKTFNLPNNSSAFTCYRIRVTECQAVHTYTTVAEIEYYGY